MVFNYGAAPQPTSLVPPFHQAWEAGAVGLTGYNAKTVSSTGQL